jgi:hypothetical protein
MSEAIGTIRSMGWEKDEETGEEVFYAHLRFPAPPPIPIKVVWDAIPVAVIPRPENAK